MRNFLLFGTMSVAALLACGDADQSTFQRHSVNGGNDTSATEPTSDAPNAGGDGVDADAATNAPPSASDAGSDAAPPVDAGPKTCIDAVASPGSGKHHAGADCMSCHDSLGSSKRWTVAGTLYSAITGGTAVSGATIVVVDGAGKTIQLKTYDNGNFYTTQSVTLPLKVRATKCPSDLSMSAAATSGSCNGNGCHDSARRIHLP